MSDDNTVGLDLLLENASLLDKMHPSLLQVPKILKSVENARDYMLYYEASIKGVILDGVRYDWGSSPPTEAHKLFRYTTSAAFDTTTVSNGIPMQTIRMFSPPEWISGVTLLPALEECMWRTYAACVVRTAGKSRIVERPANDGYLSMMKYFWAQTRLVDTIREGANALDTELEEVRIVEHDTPGIFLILSCSGEAEVSRIVQSVGAVQKELGWTSVPSTSKSSRVTLLLAPDAGALPEPARTFIESLLAMRLHDSLLPDYMRREGNANRAVEKTLFSIERIYRRAEKRADIGLEVFYR